MTVLVANWKMNLGAAEAIALAEELVAIAAPSSAEIWVTPAFPLIPIVAPKLKGSRVRLGAQNVHWAPSGAFTGEVSRPMLVEAGCTFAIVGHSERRRVMGENDEVVARRLAGAAHADFQVILCVGETVDERSANQTEAVLRRQLDSALTPLSAEQRTSVMIAYEPVWAIGSGVAATGAEITAAHSFIAQHCATIDAAMKPRVIYGGSVTETSLPDILAARGVAGCLVGSASVRTGRMKSLIDIVEKKKS